MRVWVVAGGTGGHFYPGLAVAKEFLSQGDSVRFLVRKNDFVLPFLTRENIPFTEISAAGFRRSLHPLNTMVPFKLVWGFVQSFFALLHYRPELVVVMGGYLSVPPAVSAWFFRIPLLLHEQNVLPGLANRFLSVLAKKVAISFPDSQSTFGSKAVVTGNPLRPEFKIRPEKKAALSSFRLESGRVTILVFGGSLGARVVNRTVLDVLKSHSDWAEKIQLIHFSGKSDEVFVQKAYESLPFLYFCSGYCHDMVSAYAAADFVVCRSGASTITELIAVQKPAFLIPYPYATADHQMKNAVVLAQVGAAEVCREGPELRNSLEKSIKNLVENRMELERQQKAYSHVGLDPMAAAEKIRRLAVSLI